MKHYLLTTVVKKESFRQPWDKSHASCTQQEVPSISISKDGLTLANLLDIEMEGSMIARGRLAMTKEDKECKLCK